MIGKIEYHPLVENARHKLWGKVGLIRGEDWNGWQTLGKDDKARYLAARVGCPVVESLLADPKYGPDYLVQRYGNVAFMFGLLQEAMPPALKEQFGAPVDLTSHGGIRRHDANWVPENRKAQVSGAETYHGYVLPRQAIDLIGKAIEKDDAVKVLIEAEQVVATSSSLNAAVADLAKLGLTKGITMKKTLDRIFPEDYRDELPLKYIELHYVAIAGLLGLRNR